MRKMLLFLGVLCLIVFCFLTYKTFKFGNNISNKNEEEFIEYFLNDIKSYTANIKVVVYSNKTEKEYEIRQLVEGNKSIQEIINPDNINGMKFELEGNTLKISNTLLNIEKIYEQYENILNNSLFLNVFIKEYKENKSRIYEENNEIILETKIENSINTYAKYKELHINKNDRKITSLIIKDNNQKTRINIKYNDIEIK